VAVRLAGSGESVVDVPPKLSARVRVLSSFAGNARREAFRCLKRRISDAVLASLVADSQAPSHSAA